MRLLGIQTLSRLGEGFHTKEEEGHVLMTDTTIVPFRKPADNHHPIHDLIRERWSPRAFADRSVEPEKLASVFEAARWAASASNQQPWHFLFASREDQDAHARFVSILLERNVQWAQYAPVLILVVARHYEAPGRERASLYDVGMAAGNLVTEAVNLGLATHQMAGFDANKAVEILHIPAGHEPLAMIALGYPGDPGVLPDGLREREKAPRVRKPVSEFVFAGQWDEPFEV
jgi:nitroreductase